MRTGDTPPEEAHREEDPLQRQMGGRHQVVGFPAPWQWRRSAIASPDPAVGLSYWHSRRPPNCSRSRRRRCGWRAGGCSGRRDQLGCLHAPARPELPRWSGPSPAPASWPPGLLPPAPCRDGRPAAAGAVSGSARGWAAESRCRMCTGFWCAGQARTAVARAMPALIVLPSAERPCDTERAARKAGVNRDRDPDGTRGSGP